MVLETQELIVDLQIKTLKESKNFNLYNYCILLKNKKTKKN